MLLGQITNTINTVKFLVCVLLLSHIIQQWPCRNNIVTDKALHLFDDCAAECVPLLLRDTVK